MDMNSMLSCALGGGGREWWGGGWEEGVICNHGGKNMIRLCNQECLISLIASWWEA